MLTTFLIVFYIFISLTIATVLHSMFSGQFGNDNIFECPLLLALLWPIVALEGLVLLLDTSMKKAGQEIRKIYKDKKMIEYYVSIGGPGYRT